jgi:hypothetical protein
MFIRDVRILGWHCLISQPSLSHAATPVTRGRRMATLHGATSAQRSNRSAGLREALLARAFHSETDLQRHLKVADLTVFDVAARLHNLEPTQIAMVWLARAIAELTASSMLLSEVPASSITR